MNDTQNAASNRPESDGPTIFLAPISGGGQIFADAMPSPTREEVARIVASCPGLSAVGAARRVEMTDAPTLAPALEQAPAPAPRQSYSQTHSPGMSMRPPGMN